MADPDSTNTATPERSSADLSSLLVELSRALKGLTYYSGGPARRDIVARAFLAWQIEIERAGPLELCIDAQCVRAAGIQEPLGALHLDGLLRTLHERGVESLRFDRAITQEAFDALVEWLLAEAVENGTPPELAGVALNAAPAPGSSAQPSAEAVGAGSRARGGEEAEAGPTVISLGSSLLRPTHFGNPEGGAGKPDGGATDGRNPAGAAAVSSSQASQDDHPAVAPASPAQPPTAIAPDSAAGPAPVAVAPAATAQAATTTPPSDAHAPSDPAPAKAQDTVASEPSAGAHAGHRPGPARDTPSAAAPSAAARTALSSTSTAVPPTVEPAAQVSPASPSAEIPKPKAQPNSALELSELLRQLEACRDDEEYRGLAKQIEERLRAHRTTPTTQDDYAAVQLVALHASGDGIRSAPQQRCAEGVFGRLMSGSRLDDLIRRATRTSTKRDLTAALILVQVGARAVPRLLAAIAGESDPGYAKRLTSIFMMLDDRSIPALRRAVSEGNPSERRAALRLAAKVRHPDLIRPLVALLDANSPELQRLAGEALAQTGGRQAVKALGEALGQSREGLPELAAKCLGDMGEPAALSVLLPGLDAACRRGRGEAAQGILRAIARIQDRSAVPALVGLLERQSLFRRRMYRGVHVEALITLSQLPGSEARRATYRALHSRDPVVREKAQELVSAREEALEQHASEETP